MVTSLYPFRHRDAGKLREYAMGRMSDNGSYKVLVLVGNNCYWSALCINTLHSKKNMEVWLFNC